MAYPDTILYGRDTVPYSAALKPDQLIGDFSPTEVENAWEYDYSRWDNMGYAGYSGSGTGHYRVEVKSREGDSIFVAVKGALNDTDFQTTYDSAYHPTTTKTIKVTTFDTTISVFDDGTRIDDGGKLPRIRLPFESEHFHHAGALEKEGWGESPATFSYVRSEAPAPGEGSAFIRSKFDAGHGLLEHSYFLGDITGGLNTAFKRTGFFRGARR